MKKIILVSFYLFTTLISFSQNAQLAEIQDSVGRTLSLKFGYHFELDSGMDTGCFNYLDSYLSKTNKPFVDGQAHYHDLFILENDPTDYPPTFFAKGIIESVESEELESVFNIFEPTRFYVTTKIIDSKNYLIIALD